MGKSYLNLAVIALLLTSGYAAAGPSDLCGEYAHPLRPEEARDLVRLLPALVKSSAHYSRPKGDVPLKSWREISPDFIVDLFVPPIVGGAEWSVLTQGSALPGKGTSHILAVLLWADLDIHPERFSKVATWEAGRLLNAPECAMMRSQHPAGNVVCGPPADELESHLREMSVGCEKSENLAAARPFVSAFEASMDQAVVAYLSATETDGSAAQIESLGPGIALGLKNVTGMRAWFTEQKQLLLDDRLLDEFRGIMDQRQCEELLIKVMAISNEVGRHLDDDAIKHFIALVAARDDLLKQRLVRERRVLDAIAGVALAPSQPLEELRALKPWRRGRITEKLFAAFSTATDGETRALTSVQAKQLVSLAEELEQAERRLEATLPDAR